MPTKPNFGGQQQPYVPSNGEYSQGGGSSASKGQAGGKTAAFATFGRKPDPDKQRKLEIILRENPAYDETATWIRKVEDIYDYSEILSRSDEESRREGDWSYEDWTKKDAEKAFRKGFVTVYSSKPIKAGTFVTPSLEEAHEYSGDQKPYSKKVSFDEIAWLDGEQGQYTGKTTVDTIANEDRYSFLSKATPVWMKKGPSRPYKAFNIQTLNLPRFQAFKQAFSGVPLEQTYLLPQAYVDGVLAGQIEVDPETVASFYDGKKSAFANFGRASK